MNRDFFFLNFNKCCFGKVKNKMRCHKKTKESGFFEGEFESDVNMGKALKRTKVFTTSSDLKSRNSYTTEELETHIRSTNNSQGTSLNLTTKK